MGACPNCRSSEIEYDSAAGNSVCIRCGAVVEENAVVAEVTFAELANGASVLEGQFISAERGKTALPTIFGRRVGDLGKGDGVSAESREMTLANGRRRIQALAGAVGLNGEHYIDAAHRWYALALQHQFTRGRRGPNVIAACLYIVCRQERTSHMLLDFADILSTSVYSLGGTFLRLVRLLNLEMPIVDPSFFVARFAARLEFGERTSQVSNTALRVVARMKRDWIQTGRRPAGVCAAGLIIAARMHGFRRTESEVVRVVRICEATLKKRLEEFGRTPSSQLTPQEFEGIWLEQEADPPSFTHTRPKPAEPNTVHILPSAYLQLAGSQSQDDNQMIFPLTPESQPPSLLFEEKDTLSDVEIDEEIETMLLSSVEVDVKTRYWTEMNKDYLEKEAEKTRLKALENTDAAAAAAAAVGPLTPTSTKTVKDGYESDVVEPPHTPIAKNLRKRTRAPRTTLPKDGPTAATAAEATKQVLQNKRLSKKINYEALDELFTSTAAAITTITR
jgi:transcription factor IIIB subunit 2